MRRPFSKPYLPVAEQIALLRSRGMQITDEARAAAALERIGYYRLSGYWYPLRGSVVNSDGTTTILDQFQPNAEFGQVVDLYVFDKKLRLIMLDALERVEVGLRTDIALLLGARSALAHREPQHLHSNFARRLMPNRPTTRHAE